VFPGKPDSDHIAELLPKPTLDQVPNGRGVLVKVLRVGVDGTDKEINAAEYGAAPPGYDFLVIGHEGFGQVEAVGPNATELKPGDYVVATVRRPGNSIYDLIGKNDVTTDDTYFERGIWVVLQAALRREWPETNGLGGCDSSTIIGLNTARYQLHLPFRCDGYLWRLLFGSPHGACLVLAVVLVSQPPDRGRLVMARLIPFCLPQNFKPPKRHWIPLEYRGKIIEFQSFARKKSS
jgi:hypothetical protein